MRQTIWTTRRALWAAGVGVAGFILGTGAGPVGSGLGALWGGAIGYGFGSIFGQTLPTKWLVAYWGATLALVGPFFGLLVGALMNAYATVLQQTVAGAIGAAVGMLLGSFIGIIQLRRLRRISQDPHSSSAVQPS